MTNILAVLVYPVVIAMIIVVGAVLARRARRQPPEVTPPARVPRGQHVAAGGTRGQVLREATADAGRYLLVFIGGTVVVCFITVLLGLLVVHNGPAIDKPFFNWTITHRVHVWASVMKRATKAGDVWTTWGAAGAAAVCLAVTWRSRRWLPPLALGSLIVFGKYAVIGIHHFIHRVGPPTSPLGTFPSGGVSRVVVFYGLIAYLLWREFSGSRRAAIWSATAIAVLAFSECYSRAYLALHWLTDALSGLVFGSLLLAVCIAAVRFVAGPPRVPTAAAQPATPAVHTKAAAPEGSA